ncbi:hypothetical protein IFO70_24660 [Phormidium tenue FACHB-886]|nr:hypothetical protein [Phormidium tenue FACHB-886]
MKLNSLAASAAIVALSGATLFASTGVAQACIYKQQGGASDIISPTVPSVDSTTTQVNSNGLNQLGIAGAGLTILAGLFGGGMLLKARLKQASAADSEEVPAVETPEAEPLPIALTISKFPIEVPPAALRNLHVEESEESKDAISVR